eukprot:387443-Pleurochrysis_carterae.AAC.2
MTTHAFTWRVPGDRTGRAGNGYPVWDAGSHGPEAGAGAGARRAYGGALGRGVACGGGRAQVEILKLGERSASAPQVRMRCECSLGDYACER